MRNGERDEGDMEQALLVRQLERTEHCTFVLSAYMRGVKWMRGLRTGRERQRDFAKEQDDGKDLHEGSRAAAFAGRR